MEVAGHIFLFFLAITAMYGLLSGKRHHSRWRLAVAVPFIGALWFGMGGILTSIVGFSFGAQLFLGIRLYLAWQRNSKNLH